MSRRKLPAGSQSVNVPVLAFDVTSTTSGMLSGIAYNSAGLAASYIREGDSTFTPITPLVNASVGSFQSGGFVAMGGPVAGVYQFGVPNAVFNSGARWAVVVIYGYANMRPIFVEFELTATSDQNAQTGGIGNMDAAISTRLATAGYTAPTTPPTVQAIRQEMDANSTKLAYLDASVSSRLASANYSIPPAASAIVTALMSTTVDGVAFSKIMQLMTAFTSNKTVISTNGNIVTIHFRDRTDSADILVLSYDKTTGARANGGTIS